MEADEHTVAERVAGLTTGADGTDARTRQPRFPTDRSDIRPRAFGSETLRYTRDQS